MKTSVVVKLQVEGLHRWKDCTIDEVAYLCEMHRHIFHITCEKKVRHSDRDIEIISFKHEVANYLNAEYGNPVCNFGEMSCEMIAQELVERFSLERCIVLEDNENGAIVTI